MLFGCDSLNSIKVEEGNAKYDSRENCNALIETESNTLIVGCKNTFIPKGVEIIGEKAFYTCENLTDIIIPEGVITIGDWAFAVCSSLTSVVVPKGVEYIGSYAFAHCSNLKEITLPDGLTIIGGNAGHTFVNCSSLEEISIPKGVAWIPMGTFMDCDNLKKVNFSEGLELIAGVAFSGCSSLTEISLPEGLVEIRNYVFGDCSSLTSITIPESVTEMEDSIFSGCGKGLTIYGKTGSWAETYANENDILFSSTGISHPIEKKTISSNNVALSQTSYTYDGKAKKPTVTVKDGNTVLKEGTDYTVTYSNNVNVGTAKVIVTGKGNYTGTVTKEFTIMKAAPGQGVKDLSQCTVMLNKSSYTYDGKAKTPTVTVKDGAAALKEGTDYTVTYSNNINAGAAKVTVTGKGNYKGTVTKNFTITVKKGSSHKVGSYQYKVTGTSTVSLTGVKNNKVTKVKIPKTVKIGGKDFKATAIGSSAFKNNKKITSIEIGDNVKIIGSSAFEGCTKLSRITLGKGVTEIGGNAFKNCKKLGTITIKSSKLKKVGRNALKGIKPTVKIKVPAKKLSAYKKLFKNKGQGRKVKVLKQ